MTRAIQPVAIHDVRRRLLDLETSFLHAIAARVQKLDAVLDPRSGELLREVRLCPHLFAQHSRTDSQLAHRALLRAGYTAHELEPIINALPVNSAVAWAVEARNARLLLQKQWHATGIVFAGACWSPIEDLAMPEAGALRPAHASDVVRLLERMQLGGVAYSVWLALASTTGWEDGALGSYGPNVFCAYFQPAPQGGWTMRATSPSSGVDVAWFADAVHPEDENRLHERALGWFAAEGRLQAMSPNGLTVDEVVTQTGVPVYIARAFLERTTLREAGRWAFEAGPDRLIFLGP